MTTKTKPHTYTLWYCRRTGINRGPRYTMILGPMADEDCRGETAPTAVTIATQKPLDLWDQGYGAYATIRGMGCQAIYRDNIKAVEFVTSDGECLLRCHATPIE